MQKAHLNHNDLFPRNSDSVRLCQPQRPEQDVDLLPIVDQLALEEREQRSPYMVAPCIKHDPLLTIPLRLQRQKLYILPRQLRTPNLNCAFS